MTMTKMGGCRLQPQECSEGQSQQPPFIPGENLEKGVKSKNH